LGVVGIGAGVAAYKWYTADPTKLEHGKKLGIAAGVGALVAAAGSIYLGIKAGGYALTDSSPAALKELKRELLAITEENRRLGGRYQELTVKLLKTP
jgi:hypothetical protein